MIEFYGVLPDQDYTLGEAFLEWVEYKRTFTGANYKPLSPSTIRRYERDYDRLIKGSGLETLKITVDGFTLKQELKAIVVHNRMTPVDFGNLYGYMTGIFDMLLDSRRISASPLGKTTKQEVKAFCKEPKKKSDEERVLSVNGLERLREATEAQINKHHTYIPNYAVLLATMTGMRVGELSALHWTDIRDGFIHIDHSEHRYDYADHIELVIGEPKCGKHRKIPITPNIGALLSRIEALGIDSEWVFARKNGSRHTAHDISCACDRRAKEAGLAGSSIHEIRRTVSSIWDFHHYPC